MKATVSDFGDVTALCEQCVTKLEPGTYLRDVEEQTCRTCMFNLTPKTCCRCTKEGNHYVISDHLPQFSGQIGAGVKWSELLGFVEVVLCRECVQEHWEPVYACGNQVALVQTTKWEFPRLDPSIETPLAVSGHTKVLI